MKRTKKLTALLLACIMMMSLCVPAVASKGEQVCSNNILSEYVDSACFVRGMYENFENPLLVIAYIDFSTLFPQIKNISLDMFVSLYYENNYSDEAQYLKDFVENVEYYNWESCMSVQANPVVSDSSNRAIVTRSVISGSDAWYYNTGTSLPEYPTYGTTYDLLTTAKTGDIIYEDAGLWGLTGHIAVVEGIFYDSSKSELYVRLIEAISAGVVRSVLDDDRFVDREGSIYRVSSATSIQKTNVVVFCRDQIGKDYQLNDTKRYSRNEPDWYCSELAWAAYYSQTSKNFDDNTRYDDPVFPREIRDSNLATKIVSYE